MGRHSAGGSSRSAFPPRIGVIVAVISIAALTVIGWWVTQRQHKDQHVAAPNDEQTQQTPTSDTCPLIPVAASDERIANSVMDSIEAESKDCVRTELVQELSDAVIFIAPDSPATDDALESAQRTVEKDPTPVAVQRPAVRTSTATDDQDPQPKDVSFDESVSPEVRAVAAQAIGAGPADIAAKADAPFRLVDDATQSSSDKTIEIDADVVHFAYLLTQNNAKISPAQADAARAAVSSVGSTYEGPKTSTPIDPSVWQAVMNEKDSDADQSTPSDQQLAVSSPATNTLYLLDTSLATVQYYPEAAEGIGSAAVELVGQDANHEVALWNYSSPLNPGVTKGWRLNVNFTSDGAAINDSVRRFGLGGVPQTRSSLIAALENARSQADETGEKVRIVLITSGNQDLISDDELRNAFASATEGGAVEVAAIHIGPGTADPIVRELSDEFLEVNSPEELTSAVREASGL